MHLHADSLYATVTICNVQRVHMKYEGLRVVGMPIISEETYRKYVDMADRLIAEHGFDTTSFSRRSGKLEVIYGYARKVHDAVRELSGNELLELAHTADSRNAGESQEALKAMHVDITTATASRLIRAAAAAALAIIIANRVQDPPRMPRAV